MGRTHLISAGVLAIVLLGVFIWGPTQSKLASRNEEPIKIAGDEVVEFNPVAERQKWSEKITRLGAERAWQELKNEYAVRDFASQHLAAHLFGELLYDKEGVAGIIVCDNALSFGCYHSFFARAISEKGTVILAELDATCVYKFGPLGTGCQHGIGHGILEYLGHANLEEALDTCPKIPRRHPLFGCTSGVFMEYNFPIIIRAGTASAELRQLDSQNPYAPCPALNQEFRESCYYEIGQWWDQVLSKDYRKMGLLCGALTMEEEREICFKGVGHVAAPSSNYSIDEAINKCETMPSDEGKILCRAGASWSFWATPEYRSRSGALCEGMSALQKARCLEESKLVDEKGQ